MSPRNLVCARCWHDFFDTEAFENCCTGNSCDNGRAPSAGTTALVSEIGSADCNWCSYVRSFIQDKWRAEYKISIRLSSSSIDSCTPKGRNIFYLSIDCHGHDPIEDWIGGYALFLHAWTSADDNASRYVTARHLRTDVDSATARSQLRTWLKECTTHKGCKASQRESRLPTRVIEINPAGRQYPRLIESEGLYGVYATLSYCWGESPFSTLTHSNYDALIEGLDPSVLPPTFIDAISTARNLSLPYLWIDALCIVQDSEEDKAREMARMKEIYASSTLTIIAAAAKSVSPGFLYPRPHSEMSCTIPFRVRSGTFGTMSVNELDAACYDERSEPLAKRAWTLQEQLLAQRTLTFTQHTMVWRCCLGTRNYGDSLNFPHDLDSGYNDNDEKYSLNLQSLLLNEEDACTQPDKALSCWLRLVTAYSLRTASLERDKLNAVAGIASHPSFSRSLGPSYYAGLWQYKLARQLVWRALSWHRTLPESGCIVRRPKIYRAPSWSWASIEGGCINFDFIYAGDDEATPEIVCDILDCSTAAVRPELNPFAEVLSGTLRLRTAARRAWFRPSTSNLFVLHMLTSETENLLYEEYITLDQASARHRDEYLAEYPDTDLIEDPKSLHGTEFRNMCGGHDETGPHDDGIVICAAITIHTEKHDGVKGLLLVPSENANTEVSYRRIGFFERGRKADFPTETRINLSIV